MTIHNITKTEAIVLRCLIDRETYGYDMVKSSNGTLKTGSIYVLLGRLEQKGIVQSRLEDNYSPSASRPPRRLYKFTERGKRIWNAYVELQSILDPVSSADL